MRIVGKSWVTIPARFLLVIFLLLGTLASTISSDYSPAASNSPILKTGKAASPTAPILLVYNSAYSSNKLSPFLGEIMKAEGFNNFDTDQLANVTSTELANYDTVVLAETSLSAGQITLFTGYVQGGGNLIAMRPDTQLAGLFGLGGTTGTLTNAYVAIQEGTYGQGFVTDSLQTHTTATTYSTATGQVVAKLYSNATTSTSYPAVVVNSSGAGTAAAFTYDLASSVVYLRQGDPNQVEVDADKDGVIRTGDMFNGWLNLDKMPLPQADIQQRLFARILGKLNNAKKPLPRFWYFPNAKNSTVIITSDAHGNPDSYYSNMITSMGKYNATTTFYMSQAGQPSPSNVNSWKTQGFTFSTHPYKEVWSLTTGFTNADSWFDLTYGARTVKTERIHRVQWQGWVDGGKIASSFGYTMDYSYYRYGPWLQKPDGTWARGYMIGSGLPMKQIDASGNIVNDFIQYTEIADDQMNNAGTGPENMDDATSLIYTKQAVDASEAGNNQAIAMQMHVDYYSSEQAWAENTLSYVKSLNIPIFNGDTWYTYTQNRYNSTISNPAWSGTQLNFTATIPTGQTGQTIMLPQFSGNGGTFNGVTVNGSTASYTTRAVRGENFVFVTLPAGTSNIVASYNGGTNPLPVISSVTPGNVPNNAATTVTINGANFLATPTVQMGTQFLSGVTLNSSTNLSAVVPAGMALGAYDLKVTNPDNQVATLAGAINVKLPAPTLSSVSPTFGSNAANVTVGLSGTNFVTGSVAQLNGGNLATTYNSATSLSVVIPAGTAAGTISLSVVNPDGQTATLPNVYTVGAASDTTPPAISAPGVTNITASGATISWTTTEPSTTQVDYGITTSYGTSVSQNTTLVTTHSVNLSNLNGNTIYHYQASSTDASGNTGITGDLTFTTPPAVPITLVGDQTIEAQIDNNPAGTAEAFQYTAVATGPANKMSVYLDGSSTATKVVVGVYTDNANNPGTLLDQATINTPVKGAWNQVDLTAGATLTSGSKYWITILGPSGAGTVQFRDTASGGRAQASSQTNLSTLPASWSPGSTYFNSPMSAYVVQLGSSGPDTQPPVVTMSTPTGGSLLSGKTVTVSATATDNTGVTSVQFLLDGLALGAAVTTSPYSITWDTTTATNGTHTLSAKAFDAAGNSGTATNVSVTVDNQAPTVSITAPSTGATVSGSAVTLSATASDNIAVASVQFLLDGVALGTADTAAPFTISWDTTTATNGTHTLGAQAKDTAGNTTSATTVSVTVSITVVTNPPVISGVTATAVTSGGATITWTTNVAATSQVNYGLSTAYGSSSPLDSTLVTTHSVTLTGLTASTLYHYVVVSKDSSNNSTTSADFTFTTSSATSVVLVGDQKIESGKDNNPAGMAEAFQYTALATGTVSKLSVYLDSTSSATRVVVGIYTDSSNNAGTLLGQATIASPVKGAWNTVTMPAGITITSGQKYWIAILGPSGAGTVQFRDAGTGGRAQVSSQTNLTALPATWSVGKTYLDAPMSAYVTT